jgi:outer membrane protein assembly factor BamB
VARNLAIISGYELGTRAFRITEANGKLAAEPVWQNEGAAMFISSPVVQGGHLYGLARIRGGSIVCLSLADGQRVWSSRGNLGEYASFIRAGDKLLVLTGKGELLVVAADPSEYRELARIRVTDDPSWAHLALAGSRLYVKDKTHLTCFELAEK